MDAASLFELELVRRGVGFTRVDASRFLVQVAGHRLDVSTDNLTRLALSQPNPQSEQAAVGRWVDAVLESATVKPMDVADLLWCLTPRGALPADRTLAHPISRDLVRSLTASVDDDALLRSVTDADLTRLGVDRQTASDAAYANLDRRLQAASFKTALADGVSVAWFGSDLPTKASLLLAPTLRDRVQAALGWPVLAIAPARDFLLMWPADRRDLITRLGTTVRREYLGSPYPLSPELFELGDALTAIGRLDV